VKICQERKRYATEAFGPIGVTIDTIYTDANGQGVGVAETGEQRFQRWYLNTSGRGEIKGIKNEHHVCFPPEAGQADLAAKMISKGEPGSLRSDVDHETSHWLGFALVRSDCGSGRIRSKKEISRIGPEWPAMVSRERGPKDTAARPTLTRENSSR